MRILHVLHHSLPILSGYGIRTDYIVRSQKALGLQVAAVTASQQAADDTRAYQPREVISGIDHWRTKEPAVPNIPILRHWQLMHALERRVMDAIDEFHPDVVHSHSPVLVGWPALRAARRCGVPFVYEVRDLWENASVDLGKFSARSPAYYLARAADTLVLRRADAVVAICRTLRDALAARVGDSSKVSVVDNGVDVDLDRVMTDREPKLRWGLEGKEVLCYVGTFKPYEGLELLIRALPAIVRERPSAHVLIVGGGEQDHALRSAVRTLGVDRFVTFTGPVPHAEVVNAYAAADVMVYPRILTRTTALTTPLKPLEAMALMTPVIVSDIPPMRELVQHEKTGWVFTAGDVEDLTRTCVRALGDRDRREEVSRNARDWVVRNRQWRTLAERYTEIYRTLVAHGERQRRAS
jgi:PEP-CTERM/exosortase A-associated glycosyltransferase